MAINNDQFQINPYTSTVPLVQVPPDAIEGQSRPAAPLQGQFGKKGTGALAIGDSLLKGFMLGHQQKEQKKQAQAQATINAADAASEAAYRQYQDALTKSGGKQDDPSAQAAYQAYIQAFQAGKQAKAQFVIPEKGQKGKKGDADPVRSPDGKKKTASAGFNNIKDFFEANPHIIPQIALVTMQPKPQGLAPEGQQAVQSLESQRTQNESAARHLQNQKTYQEGFSTYAHLSQDEIAALPPDAKKGFETWQNARAAIAPTKYSGSSKLYQLANGKKAYLYPEEANEFYPDAQPVETTAPKPGTPGFYLNKKAEELGKKVNDLSTEEINAATAEYRAAQVPQTSTTSTSTTTPQGDRTTTTTRKASPGGISKPPTVKSAASGQGRTGITPPPQAGKTAKAGMSAPPGGKQTALTASVTRQAVKEQQAGYRKAETAYTNTLAKADKEFAAAQKQAATTGDQSIIATAQAAKDRAYARAKLDLEDAKVGVAKQYDAAVRSIGGVTGSQQTKQVRYYQGHAYVQDETGQWKLQTGQ